MGTLHIIVLYICVQHQSAQWSKSRFTYNQCSNTGGSKKSHKYYYIMSSDLVYSSIIVQHSLEQCA